MNTTTFKAHDLQVNEYAPIREYTPPSLYS
jgi:hypothetical protein